MNWGYPWRWWHLLAALSYLQWLPQVVVAYGVTADVIMSLSSSSSFCAAETKLFKRMTAITIETDKFDSHHNYQRLYAQLFRCSTTTPMAFLEIGLACYIGHKVMEPRMWRGFLPSATLNFIEIEKNCLTREPYLKSDVNGKVFLGDQSDVTFLQQTVAQSLPSGVDVIIDDGSHFPRHHLASFEYLFPTLLHPGGYYVIEDLFTNFFYKVNESSGVSSLRYISRIMEALSGNGTLPVAAWECTEVICQYGICRMKKRGNSRDGSGVGPWCESSSSSSRSGGSRSRNRFNVHHPSVFSSSFISYVLSCESLTNRTVYHIQRCGGIGGGIGGGGGGRSTNDPILKRRLPIFRDSKVKPYRVGPGCFTPIPEELPFAIVDDSTLPFSYRLAVLRDLLGKRLRPGGYYFWSNAHKSAESSLPFVLGFYAQYCNVKFLYHQRSEAKMNKKTKKSIYINKPTVKYFHERLCEDVFRKVWSVGCDEAWCYLQTYPPNVEERPVMHMPTRYWLGAAPEDFKVVDKLTTMLNR